MASKQLVSATFKKQLFALETLREQINKGHFALAAAYIEFAERFTTLLDEAKAQDKANGTKTYVESVLELGTLDGSQLTTSTVSKWRKIAEEARELKKNQKYLPSSRDALYFIAQGVEKGVKIGTLGSKGVLSAESTLTDIKKLLTPAKKDTKRKPKRKASSASEDPINMGTPITPMGAVNLEVSMESFPMAVQKLLSKGEVMLKVRADIDPDTNAASLVAVGYGQ